MESRRLAVLTRGLSRVATLPALLDDWNLLRVHPLNEAPADAVLAWGRKPSAAAAEAFARRRGLPLLRAEDGFLRSVALGHRDPPCSIVLDDLGIHYDAGAPSRLERLVATPLSPGAQARARALREAWRAGRVSKYNHARESTLALPQGHVLVVDQTAGDASIAFGLADAGSFARMLEAALDEHPGRPVLLKVHPDVIAGRKRGHFDRLTAGQASRVTLLAGDAHPPGLLEHAECVYAVTSQMGFEALLWGRPVRAFGMPFYAGWGLTEDALPAPGRRRPVALDNLVHAALVDYARYVDPETGLRCEPEALLAHLALQRRMRERFPARVHALGFSRWKRPVVRAFLGGSDVSFARRTSRLPPDATLAVWGRQPVPDAMRGRAARLLRLEDGFLRSVGLGAELVRPVSWVTDGTGIHFDASAPSDLEALLQHADMDDPLRARAAALRTRIVALGLTKYNVGAGNWTRPPHATRVVLVPGQVEGDASLLHGAPGIRTNLELLQAVRMLDPAAHVVYKPHPDVLAGLRRAGSAEHRAHEFCDAVVTDVPLDTLLRQVDAVHVLTSLAGFEALLRGLPVTVHGCPFYAGWGLTTDRLPMPRRTRRRTLDELVAAALILYPAYVSRRTGRFTTPERVLDELARWREQGAAVPPLWRRMRRRLLGLFSARN